MSEVSVIVPWRATPERAPLWEYCEQVWHNSGVVDEIIECDSGQVPFTRGTSINRGAEDAQGDIFVLADADTFVSDPYAAVQLVREGTPWVIAYGDFRYYRVSPAVTESYLTRSHPQAMEPTNFLERCRSYSGVLVMRREAFEAIGGFDERFLGWGEEDVAFMEAMNLLVGHYRRASGWAVQLYHHHIEAERYECPSYPPNRLLGNRYAAARGDRLAMEKLVGEALEARAERAVSIRG